MQIFRQYFPTMPVKKILRDRSTGHFGAPLRLCAGTY